MENCIFCKIIKGEIPSYRVYEDDFVLAFLDIAPIRPGHALAVPKAHFGNFEEIPEKLLGQVLAAVKKIGLLMKNNLDVAGYNVLENNDPVAGQVIPHLHFHIIPRSHNDGLRLWPQGEYSPGEAEAIMKRMTHGK